MKLQLFICCFMLCSCRDRAVKEENQQRPAAGNIMLNEGLDFTNDIAAGGDALTPEEREEELARIKRDDEEMAREERWRESVLPTPRHAFPKIGTCYQTRIKELEISHERISEGPIPGGRSDTTGQWYWDNKWSWEKNPIRDHGRIAIPVNGYILYTRTDRHST